MQGQVTEGAVLALWRLLVVVLGTSAPRPHIVALWSARDRARARAWAERELARKTVGTDGCPPLQVPPSLERYVEGKAAA